MTSGPPEKEPKGGVPVWTWAKDGRANKSIRSKCEERSLHFGLDGKRKSRFLAALGTTRTVLFVIFIGHQAGRQ